MNSTKRFGQMKQSLVIGSLGLLPAVSGFAHGEEATTGWNGFMGGWSHWGMAGGWIWVFPTLTLLFLIVALVTLMKAGRTPKTSAVITQQDRATKKE